MTSNKFICCLCAKSCIGYGHNPEPLKSGRCCDDCDNYKVIPARIKLATFGKDLSKEFIKRMVDAENKIKEEIKNED